MKQTLTFKRSIMASTQSQIEVDAFDKSLEAFDNKEFMESFLLLLDYINPEIRHKYGNADGSQFTVPHGSIIVNIQIEDEKLLINAPFLKVPTSSKIPLLRQAAELNFNYMNLPQICLKDNELYFEYQTPLALAEPYKIYYLLEDICHTGDKYDDEFVDKFGAARICEPKIQPYSTEQIDDIYQLIQDSCTECKETIKEFENTRKFGYQWNILSCTVYKILYYAHPQGKLLNDLNKAIYNLDRTKIPLSDVIADGKEVIEKLQSTSKEEIAKDLYYIQTFIPPKRRSILKNIQDNFKEEYEKATNSYQTGDMMTCCIRIVYEFYRLYFYNNVQDDINAVVVHALENSSAIPWDKAAPTLYQAMTQIMEGNLTVKRSSFLSKLFGKNK
jgi:hypothetical protein